MPFCEYEKPDSNTCNSMGYLNCGFAACAKDKATCATEISNMVSKTLTGIAKFLTLLQIPSASLFTELGNLASLLLPYLTKVFDYGLQKLDDIEAF